MNTLLEALTILEQTGKETVVLQQSIVDIQTKLAQAQARLQAIAENLPEPTVAESTAPVPAPAGPTPVTQPAEALAELDALRVRVVETQRKVEVVPDIRVLAGPKSYIAAMLSPTVYQHGRGVVQPGYTTPAGTIQQYRESVTATAYNTLVTWPSGFYTNDKTGELQYYARLPTDDTEYGIKGFYFTNLGDPSSLTVLIDRSELASPFVSYEALCAEDYTALQSLLRFWYTLETRQMFPATRID